jgi:HSF-type DNA-binding
MLIMISIEKTDGAPPDSPGNVPLLRWGQSDTNANILVFNCPDLFASEVLPLFALPATTFNSLVRKMYRWGFRRVHLDDKWPVIGSSVPQAFASDKFRRGDFSLLMNMASKDSRVKKFKTHQITQPTQGQTRTTEIRLTDGSVPEMIIKRRKVSQATIPRRSALRNDSSLQQPCSLASHAGTNVDGRGRVSNAERSENQGRFQSGSPTSPLEMRAYLTQQIAGQLSLDVARSQMNYELFSSQSQEENALLARVRQLRADIMHFECGLCHLTSEELAKLSLWDQAMSLHGYQSPRTNFDLPLNSRLMPALSTIHQPHWQETATSAYENANYGGSAQLWLQRAMVLPHAGRPVLEFLTFPTGSLAATPIPLRAAMPPTGTRGMSTSLSTNIMNTLSLEQLDALLQALPGR